MKFLKSKFFIICLLVAILLAATASALSMSGQTDILRGALGTIAKPFLWCGNIFSNAVNGFTCCKFFKSVLACAFFKPSITFCADNIAKT